METGEHTSNHTFHTLGYTLLTTMKAKMPSLLDYREKIAGFGEKVEPERVKAPMS